MKLEYAFKECKTILDNFGVDSQLQKAIEELDECRTELILALRKQGHTDSIIDEIADSFVVLLQMSHIYGSNKILERINYKINRTKKIFHDRDLM